MSALSAKEQVTRALDDLSESEIQQVSEFIAFLKFRAQFARATVANPAELVRLYAEGAEEGRRLAEDGITEYRGLLQAEDQQ
jgi:hypothetical protein